MDYLEPLTEETFEQYWFLIIIILEISYQKKLLKNLNRDFYREEIVNK